MIPPICEDPSRLLVGIDVHWWTMMAYSIVCKPNDDPVAKCPEMRPILYGWLAALLTAPMPAYVAAFLDSSGPTWRHLATSHLDHDKRYKAGRKARPREYYDELAGFIEVLQKHGIPCYQAEGWEADDVAATVVREATASGLDVALVTLDHDWLALARAATTEAGEVYCWSYGRRDAAIMCVKDVIAKHRVVPRQIQDLTALCGDGDNIKGVPGIGPDKAAKLITRWGSVGLMLDGQASGRAGLEEDVKAAERASVKASKAAATAEILAVCSATLKAARLERDLEKWRAIVVAHRETVELCLTLATLDQYAPLEMPFSVAACVAGRFDVEALKRVFSAGGFTALARAVA